MINTKYNFTLEKYFEYEDKTLVHIITDGIFSYNVKEEEETNTSINSFFSEQFRQKSVKASLISPLSNGNIKQRIIQ